MSTAAYLRPSTVRILLARSITMTASEVERRVRTRRRQPSTEAARAGGLRAELDARAAQAGVVRSAVVLR
jgi:hypothetical protein